MIGHDHDVTVSQAVDRGVVLVVLETQDLLDVLDLDILYDLVVAGFSDVEQLASKREDAVFVASDNTETGDSESFGGVSFCEDEGASFGITATGAIGVFQLDDTGDSRPFGAVRFFEDLILFEFGPIEDIIDDARF